MKTLQSLKDQLVETAEEIMSEPKNKIAPEKLAILIDIRQLLRTLLIVEDKLQSQNN